MNRLLKYFAALFFAMSIPVSAQAILVTQTWKITLTTAGTAQTIVDPTFTNLRYVPAFRVFNLSSSAGTNAIYVGHSDVSATNAEPIAPQRGVAYSNEQTTGQNEKMFDIQQILFDADTDATAIIVTVMYDDGN